MYKRTVIKHVKQKSIDIKWGTDKSTIVVKSSIPFSQQLIVQLHGTSDRI